MKLEVLVSMILKTFALLLLACASVPQQGERLTPGEDAPWKALEQQLHDAGAKTDTSSLIALAGSGSEAQLRWFAIEILGLRQEQAAREELWRLVSSEEDRLLKETAALALARLGD